MNVTTILSYKYIILYIILAVLDYIYYIYLRLYSFSKIEYCILIYISAIQDSLSTRHYYITALYKIDSLLHPLRLQYTSDIDIYLQNVSA
jgi:hypothetical protein